MKNILILILLITASACTENQKARNFGGTETVNLPKGQKLLNATWKGKDGANLWYLTEPMESYYVPQDKIFHEQSNFGVWEGTVIFHETREQLRDTVIMIPYKPNIDTVYLPKR